MLYPSALSGYDYMVMDSQTQCSRSATEVEKANPQLHDLLNCRRVAKKIQIPKSHFYGEQGFANH